MNKHKVNRIILWVIGVYQVLFGLLGLIASFIQVVSVEDNRLIYFLIVVAFFVFSVYSGLLLFTNNRNKGIEFSKVNQFMQILQFKIIGNGFEYVAGLYFAIGFSDTPSFNLQYKLAAYKSTCSIGIMTGDNEIKVMINLVATILIIYLYKVYSQFSSPPAD